MVKNSIKTHFSANVHRSNSNYRRILSHVVNITIRDVWILEFWVCIRSTSVFLCLQPHPQNYVTWSLQRYPP